jgi:ABC-type glutathione transport system ATPase component
MNRATIQPPDPPPPTSPQPPVLEARDLRVRYASRIGFGAHAAEGEVLRGVSLSLMPGERLAVVGESGSGKTTLLRALLRMVVPQAGQVLLQGTDLAILSPRELREQRRVMQMVFQDPVASLDPAMTVLQLVAEPLQIAGMKNGAEPLRERVVAQLAAVGIGSELLARRPAQLSGGQAQRVSIARALVSDPAILICDEPVSALDVSWRAQVLQLLSDQCRARGLALLCVTHDLYAARFLCERTLVLQRGGVVESGATRELFAAPRHAYTRELLASRLTVAPLRGASVLSRI